MRRWKVPVLILGLMRFWVIAVCLAAPAFSQDAQGVISGTVRNSVTGAPVDGVSVELTSTGAPSKKQTSSPAGTFRFDQLPVGSYELRFRKSGYVDSAYDGGPVVRARPKVDGEPVDVSLVPTGSVEGRVLDEDGKPVKGVLLYAERPSKPSLMTVSEDEGRYRLDLLPPEKYWILTRASYSLRKETARRDGSTGQMMGFAPALFVPGVEDSASAAPVSVGAGAVLGGFDIRLKRIPLVAVGGRALDGETRKPFQGEVEMVPEKGTSDGSRKALGADGSFAFDLIPDGRYTLFFYRGTKDALAFASPLDTGAGGVAGLAVTVPPFTRLTGRVVGPASGVDAVLSNGHQMQSVRAGADGGFVFEGVPPGSWRLGASPSDRLGARAWYVAAIRSGPRDVMADGLVVTEGENQPVEIVLGTDAASVRGDAPAGVRVRVADTDGHVVAEQTASSAGTFWISGLRPGEYKIHAGTCVAKAVSLKLAPSITSAARIENCEP